jgi:hypothetical protein
MNSHWFRLAAVTAYTAVDPINYNIVIPESQDGATNRYNLAAAAGKSIRASAGHGVPGGRGAGAPAAPGWRLAPDAENQPSPPQIGRQGASADAAAITC